MRRFQISTLLLLGTLGVFLTGCSKNPMSPDLNGAAQGGAQTMGIHNDDVPSDSDSGALTVTRALDHTDKDVMLTVGRFTLELKNNTLKMPATITMHVSSEDATEVEIEVVPAEANDFKKTAKLTADMSDRPNTNYGTVTMWNWKNDKWEAGSNVSTNASAQTVVAHVTQVFNSLVGEPVEGSDTERPEDMRTRNR